MSSDFDEGRRPSLSQGFIIIMGFSVFWACFLQLLFLPVEIQPNPAPVWLDNAIHLSFLLGLCSAGMGINLFADFFATVPGYRLQLACVLGSAVLMLLALFTNDLGLPALPYPLQVAIWLLVGGGLACLRMLWVERIAGFDQASIVRVVCGALVAGALLFVGLNCMERLAMTVSFALLLLLSVAVLTLVGRELPLRTFAPRELSCKLLPLHPATNAFIGLYGLVFGLAVSFCVALQPSDVLMLGIGFAHAAGTITIYFLLIRNSGKMILGLVLRVLLPFVVIGFLPMPFVSGVPYILCALLLIVCLAAFTVVNLSSQIAGASHFNCSPQYLVGKGGAPLLIGLALGYVLGLLFTFLDMGDTVVPYYVPLALVMLLTFFVTFLPIEGDRFAADDADVLAQADKTGRWKTRCQLVAEQAGLSLREKEVFDLLAKGRGTVYIQNKLYISSHTVKTHTSNIYRKIGVNSRESLMTLVEETLLFEDKEENCE